MKFKLAVDFRETIFRRFRFVFLFDAIQNVRVSKSAVTIVAFVLVQQLLRSIARINIFARTWQAGHARIEAKIHRGLKSIFLSRNKLKTIRRQ